MSSDQIQDRLAEVLTEPLAAVGLDLEGVELSSAGRRRVLRVAVDQDGGVTLDEIAEAAREVSKVLDGPVGEKVLGGAPYTLEVSSPGTDRPLTLPRHWRRNTDRLVKATLVEGGTVTGRVTDADDIRAVLDVDGTPTDLVYEQVRRAMVQIEFNRKES